MKTKLISLALSIFLFLPFMAAFGDPAMYDRILHNVLIHEGMYYTNTPGDPGGPTNYGITIYEVRRYIKRGATAEDVKRLTLAQAKMIYKRAFWDPIEGDTLPAGLDYVVFDYAVNAGLGRALPALHRCQIAFDNIGQQINCVSNARMAFQMGLGSWANKFKRGWRSRILSVQHIARNMAGLDKARLDTDLYLIPRAGAGRAWEDIPAEEGLND